MRDPIPDFSDFVELPEPWADLEAGNLTAALNGFATKHLLDIRRHPGNRVHSDTYLIDFGVALWLMGDCYGAANIWSHVCDQAYRGRFDYSRSGTFEGGLLLWFASVWLKDEEWHDEAAQLLDKLLRKKYPVMGATYPKLMAKLLRGEIDLPQIQASYSDTPHIREEEEWQALFYAGVRAYENGRPETTRKLWGQAKDRKGTQVAIEYYLLVHERAKLPA